MHCARFCHNGGHACTHGMQPLGNRGRFGRVHKAPNLFGPTSLKAKKGAKGKMQKIFQAKRRKSDNIRRSQTGGESWGAQDV